MGVYMEAVDDLALAEYAGAWDVIAGAWTSAASKRRWWAADKPLSWGVGLVDLRGNHEGVAVKYAQASQEDDVEVDASYRIPQVPLTAEMALADAEDVLTQLRQSGRVAAEGPPLPDVVTLRAKTAGLVDPLRRGVAVLQEAYHRAHRDGTGSEEELEEVSISLEDHDWREAAEVLYSSTSGRARELAGRGLILVSEYWRRRSTVLNVDGGVPPTPDVVNVEAGTLAVAIPASVPWLEQADPDLDLGRALEAAGIGELLAVVDDDNHALFHIQPADSVTEIEAQAFLHLYFADRTEGTPIVVHTYSPDDLD